MGIAAQFGRVLEKTAEAIAKSGLSVSLLVVGWTFLVVSGYFLSYQLFFYEMPFDKVASEISQNKKKRGIPKDVVYSHKYYLNPGHQLRFDVSAPRVTKLGKPSVRFVIKSDSADGQKTTVGPGRIRITGLSTDPFIYRLKPDGQQQFTVPWTERLGERNRGVRIRYLVSAAAAGESASPRIEITTEIVGFSVWPYVIVFALAGLALLLSAPDSRQSKFGWDWKRNSWRLVLIGAAGLLFLIHSGGFTSRVMFIDHRVIASTCANLSILLDTGHWKPAFYRNTGVGGVPILAYFLEGDLLKGNGSFCNHFPTTPYIFYTLWLTGLLFLAHTLRALFNARLAIIFIAVSALYFPFFIDLFRPYIDAYFIVLFAFYFALVLRILFDRGSFLINAGAIVLLTFLMGMTKVTPIFLTILLPVTLVLKDWERGYGRALLRCVAGICILLTAFQVGGAVSDHFQHPERNVGIEGEPFQRHVFWHMIWAAYGKYDRDSAHDFVKSGRLRNKRIVARTGLPDVTYLRQSEVAAQRVYKPDVLKAVAERPGFFFATAMHRFQKHGLRFFRYNRISSQIVGLVRNKTKGAKTSGGDPTNNDRPLIVPIHDGSDWKIAPLLLIAKLTQGPTAHLNDVLLLGAAIVGMFGFKSLPLRFFLVMTALAQLGFSFAFHDVDRYFMFCSWALLLGLSLFVLNIFAAINRSLPDRTALADVGPFLRKLAGANSRSTS